MKLKDCKTIDEIYDQVWHDICGKNLYCNFDDLFIGGIMKHVDKKLICVTDDEISSSVRDKIHVVFSQIRLDI